MPEGSCKKALVAIRRLPTSSLIHYPPSLLSNRLLPTTRFILIFRPLEPLSAGPRPGNVCGKKGGGGESNELDSPLKSIGGNGKERQGRRFLVPLAYGTLAGKIHCASSLTPVRQAHRPERRRRTVPSPADHCRSGSGARERETHGSGPSFWHGRQRAANVSSNSGTARIASASATSAGSGGAARRKLALDGLLHLALRGAAVAGEHLFDLRGRVVDHRECRPGPPPGRSRPGHAPSESTCAAACSASKAARGHRRAGATRSLRTRPGESRPAARVSDSRVLPAHHAGLAEPAACRGHVQHAVAGDVQARIDS